MEFIKNLVITLLLLAVLYIAGLVIMKVGINAFAQFVLWTAELWGMEYK